MKSLPSTFLTRLEQIYPQNFHEILQAFATNRQGSFRLNFLKTNGDDVFAEFHAKNIITKKFDLLDNVFTFDRSQEFAIKGSRAFYDGKIYLQSIASMLPTLVLNPQKWEKILDVCAAPGSKTTQIAMLQQNDGKIVALEQNQIRFDKLHYNIQLQWATNIETYKIDARKFESAALFDKILLDAPCSAEGRISLQNEKSFGFWSEENILKKSQLQTELLQKFWANLRSGGELVYSTCTLAPEENEMIIVNFLEKNVDAQILPISLSCKNESWWKSNIANFSNNDFSSLNDFGIRILPSEYTEWFFIVRLKKI